MLSLLSSANMLVLIVLLGFLIWPVTGKELMAYIGTNITLHCNLSGKIYFPEWQGPPNLTIFSLRGVETLNPLVPSVAEKRLSWSLTEHRDLLLTSVAMSDAGMYYCVYAGHGFDTFYLNVTNKTNDGLNDAAVTLNYHDSTEADRKSTGVIPADNNSAGIVTATVIVILMWLCLSCVLLHWLKTGKITNEARRAIGESLNDPFCKPRTILLFVSCCFFIGWIYLLVMWLNKEDRCHLPRHVKKRQSSKNSGSTSEQLENKGQLLSTKEDKPANMPQDGDGDSTHDTHTYHDAFAELRIERECNSTNIKPHREANQENGSPIHPSFNHDNSLENESSATEAEIFFDATDYLNGNNTTQVPTSTLKQNGTST